MPRFTPALRSFAAWVTHTCEHVGWLLDEASPWFYYQEKWARPYRAWWKFPWDYVTWVRKYRW